MGCITRLVALLPKPLCLLTLILARNPHHDGYYDRWIWIYAQCRRSRMGCVPLFLYLKRSNPPFLAVPFVYSLQARYLAFHPTTLGPIFTALTILVNGLGYYIFRAANGEKNDFRSGKDTRNLQYLTTEKGSKLITSGWWGRSRHPNYFGDILMALAWSLPTGIETPITYFYVVYFAVLLIHRQMRDDEACERK